MKRINGKKMVMLLYFYMVIACLCYKQVNTRIAFWGLKQQHLANFVPMKN